MLRIACNLIFAASVFLLIVVVVLAIRSSSTADLLLIRSPAGNLQGAAGDRDGLVIVSSDLPCGPNDIGGFISGESRTAEAFSEAHNILFEPGSITFSHAGVTTAHGQAIIKSTTVNYQAVLLSYWLLAVVATLAAAITGFAMWKHWKR